MEQREFLRKQMLKKTREKIEEKFAGKEIHIIKAVNLLTDLESITNLMKENFSEWEKRSPTGEAQKEFVVLEKNVKTVEEEKKSLIEFIEKEMNEELPNFSAIATPIIGAKMLASAGSKKKLCFFPASTIQVLGAEKALFAHIRKGAKSPKHGHLFNHPLLQNLPRSKRGNAARIIAGKLAIALKQDYFKGENTSEETKKEISKKIEELAKAPEKIKEQNETPNIERRIESERPQSKTFTPEERKAYFAKQNNSNYQRPNTNRETITRNDERRNPTRTNSRPFTHKTDGRREQERSHLDYDYSYNSSRRSTRNDERQPRSGYGYKPKSFERREEGQFHPSFKPRNNFISSEERHAKPSGHGFGNKNNFSSNKRFGSKKFKKRY